MTGQVESCNGSKDIGEGRDRRGRGLDRQDAGRLPGQGACWIKFEEERRWYLYISAETLDRLDSIAGYGVIQRFTRELNNPFLDLVRTKLVRPGDPIVPAVEEIQERFQGYLPMNYNGDYLARIPIDGAYIYATAAQVADPALAPSTSP